MTRTQLSFERETLRRAQQRAVEMGISLAEYVRRLVDEDLREAAAPLAPEAVFDLGDSGGSHVAANKDEMIGETVARGRR